MPESYQGWGEGIAALRTSRWRPEIAETADILAAQQGCLDGSVQDASSPQTPAASALSLAALDSW
jgi:hypothetical protein